MPRKRILIADDDRSLVHVLELRCRGLGLDVQASTDGLRAIVSILESPPDLVILDVNMPAADGLSVCDKMLSNRFLTPPPIIFLTGSSHPATIERCRQLGHHVVKGADMWPELRALIHKLLGGLGETTVDPMSSATQQPALPFPIATTEPQAAPRGAAETSAPARVLVIDDDRAMGKALQLRLERLGVNVATAVSAAEGFAEALKHRPDLIITDFTMPQGCGDYLLSRLKGHSLTADIPVVVLTGRTVMGRNDFSLQRTMFNLGCVAVVFKPLVFEELLHTLGPYLPAIARTLDSEAETATEQVEDRRLLALADH